MRARDCLVGLSLISGLGVIGAALAEETYDNPTLGSAPCLVLKSYQAINHGAAGYGAKAEVENICGRSVEVDFCFPLIDAGEDTEPYCRNGVIRPWATAEVRVDDLDNRLAGPDFRWRWRGHPMDSDR
ncbi:MAG: hypothetical protein HC871_06085 [Rhizobiales bacterium]|nr:hypothetical protein [Hyphomicrobiales bacterium]